jgi:hypothetical protein
MRGSVAALSALVVAAHAMAEPHEDARSVDLRGADALHQLQAANPEHFDKIRQILRALSERPRRVEEGWLQTAFDARDVALSGLLIHTSNPPKQVLRFTLEDTRYTMYLRRSDMVAGFVPAVSR